MSTRNDIYKKYYDSDIFNVNPHFDKVLIVKTKIRFNHPTYDRIKELYLISAKKKE